MNPCEGLNALVESRRSFAATLVESRRSLAATLLEKQRNFLASRDFLAQQRHDVMVAREELSRARVDLERCGAELEECERGLAQREAAIDAYSTTEQLQQQLSELRAELDSQLEQFEEDRRERMATWYDAVAKHEQELRSLGDQL